MNIAIFSTRLRIDFSGFLMNWAFGIYMDILGQACIKTGRIMFTHNSVLSLRSDLWHCFQHCGKPPTKLYENLILFPHFFMLYEFQVYIQLVFCNTCPISAGSPRSRYSTAELSTDLLQLTSNSTAINVKRTVVKRETAINRSKVQLQNNFCKFLELLVHT